MLSHASLIEDLETAIASGSGQRRVEALRSVTDLFANSAWQLSEDQVAVFDDVIGRMAEHIEVKARAELSGRLAAMDNAPINTIKALASSDEIEVAGPVLRGSNRLADHDLVETANSKSQQHLLAISKRQSLSESVTDVLVARGDREVVHSVVQNEGARFSEIGFDTLVRRSAGDDVLGERVGLRRDLPPKQFRALVAKASERVLAGFKAASGANHPHLEELMAGIAAEMTQRKSTPARDFSAAVRIVDALKSAGDLDDGCVQAFARAGKVEETAAALSALCGMSIADMESVLIGETPGDLILIVARAAKLSWPTARSLLVMASPGNSLSPSDAEIARQNFERLQIATAQRVVRFHQVRQSASKTGSAPA